MDFRRNRSFRAPGPAFQQESRRDRRPRRSSRAQPGSISPAIHRLLKCMIYHRGMDKRRVSTVDPQLVKEAKSIVVHSFRNGPIKNVHAGIKCPTCTGDDKYSHITQAEMKRIMKNAVDNVHTLLWLKAHDPEKYNMLVEDGTRHTLQWDEPKLILKL